MEWCWIHSECGWVWVHSPKRMEIYILLQYYISLASRHQCCALNRIQARWRNKWQFILDWRTLSMAFIYKCVELRHYKFWMDLCIISYITFRSNARRVFPCAVNMWRWAAIFRMFEKFNGSKAECSADFLSTSLDFGVNANQPTSRILSLIN